MRNGRNEPSMNMIRRMAATTPDSLFAEVTAARAERDNLREAITIKLSEYVRSLNITKDDILLVRRVGQMPLDQMVQMLEGMTERLRVRTGWEGVVVVEDSFRLGKLTETEQRALYDTLKKKYGVEDAKP